MKQLQEILKPYFVEGQTEVDITAVLKFIEDKGGEYRNLHGKIRIQHGHITEEVEGINLTSVNIIGNLEIKPLHLYSEQENKDLLELFEKLGT